jgi:two-component system sensor histidine kinase UhpB
LGIDVTKEVANSLAVAIQNTRLFKSVNEQQKELRALTSRLSELQEAERHRLAQELHDRVGQNLTALNLNLNVVRSSMPEVLAAKINDRLNDSLQLVQETASCIRNVMSELRPPVLDDYGLLEALRWYGEQVNDRSCIEIVIEGESLTPRLDPAVETSLFRVAQEALTNAVKHANASEIIIKLHEINGVVRLGILDDGIGFDLKQSREKNENSGWGLMTMRERITALGGKLRFESVPGKGTKIEAELKRGKMG